MVKLRLAGFAAGLASCAAPLAAQIVPPRVPTPDSIMQENRRQLEDRSRPDAPSGAPRLVEPPAAEAAPARSGSDLRFRLDSVAFDPSAYLAPDRLEALASPLIGTEIGIADLQALVERINAAYRAQGIPTARALLPPQDIKDGKVRIALIEGRIGAVSVEGGSPATQRRASAAVPPTGSLADPRVLEARLRRFNLVHDTQLRAQLAEGQTVGTTDVMVVPELPARFGAEFFADNNGFRSTGEWQAGAVLRGYRLLDADDRVTLAYSHATGVDSGSVTWGMPLAAPLRLDLAASLGSTRLLAGPQRDVRVTGRSRTFGGTLTTLVHADRRHALLATAGVQNLYSTTDVAGPRVLTNLSWQGSTGLSWSYGKPGFAAGLQAEFSGARVRERVSQTGRDIGVLRGAGNLSARLGETTLQARLRGDWQVALADDLPGFLLYQIGGVRSNRGWSPGAAAGDSGGSASAELAWGKSIGKVAGEITAFVDHAQVKAPGSFVSLQAVGIAAAASLEMLTVRGSLARGVGWKGLARSEQAFVTFNLRY